MSDKILRRPSVSTTNELKNIPPLGLLGLENENFDKASKFVESLSLYVDLAKYEKLYFDFLGAANRVYVGRSNQAKTGEASKCKRVSF